MMMITRMSINYVEIVGNLRDLKWIAVAWMHRRTYFLLTYCNRFQIIQWMSN